MTVPGRSRRRSGDRAGDPGRAAVRDGFRHRGPGRPGPGRGHRRPLTARQTYQTMAGFGASEGFGEAATVMNASASVAAAGVQRPVQPDLRGRPDLPAERISADSGTPSSRPTRAARTRPRNYVSLASIGSGPGPVVVRTSRSRPSTSVSPTCSRDAWSAPGFMKTNGSTTTAARCAASRGRAAPAVTGVRRTRTTWCSTPRTMRTPGVPLTYIGPSNEPDFSANYDSMTMSPAQMASLLDVVGPTVRNSGLSTQVECCAATGWPVSANYASAIEPDPTALADTAVLTSHGYSGAPTSPLPGWTKPAWETEWYGTYRAGIRPGTTAPRFRADLGAAHLPGPDRRQPERVPVLVGLHHARTTGQRRPDRPSGHHYRQTSGRLWAFGNYSRFVRPGAVRIGASSSTSGGGPVRLQEHRRHRSHRRAQHRKQRRHDHLLTVRYRHRRRRHGHPVPDQLLQPHRRAGRHQRQQRLVHRHHPGPLPGHLCGRARAARATR